MLLVCCQMPVGQTGMQYVVGLPVPSQQIRPGLLTQTCPLPQSLSVEQPDEPHWTFATQAWAPAVVLTQTHPVLCGQGTFPPPAQLSPLFAHTEPVGAHCPLVRLSPGLHTA